MFDIDEQLVSGEAGMSFGRWTPFVGASYTSVVEDAGGISFGDRNWGLNAGVWFEQETFKLRGVLTNVNDSEEREIFGNILFRFGNDYVVGAEGGLLLNDAEDRMSFSLQIGKFF